MFVFRILVSLRNAMLRERASWIIPCFVYGSGMVKIHTVARLICVLCNLRVAVVNTDCSSVFLDSSTVKTINIVYHTSGQKCGEFVLWSWEASAQRVERLKAHFDSVVA